MSRKGQRTVEWTSSFRKRIFIKSPDERVITKQACRDESIVSLFFSLSQCIHINIYTYTCIFTHFRKSRNSKTYIKCIYLFLYRQKLSSYIYIYIYIYIYKCIYIYIYIYIYCAQIYSYALSILMNLDVKLKKFEAIHEILVK